MDLNNQMWELLNELTESVSGSTYGPSAIGDINDALAGIPRIKNYLSYAPLFDVKKGLPLNLNWRRNNK